ncbi:hypothetical protein ACN2CC_15375 [Mesorhizobium muleiense]|uniref:hypothetical protein n=1 Tax=Mesorhizobium muleiense TaxID=1004279 RepID=UPI003AFA626A
MFKKIIAAILLTLAFLGYAYSLDIPANAHLDYTGRSWECDRGFRQSGNGCVLVTIPANAALDYTGHSWTCNRGYQQQGRSCAAVQVPANASIDYTGHSWTCNRGYQQQGQSCGAIRLPQNAELDYTGHSWKCTRGFRSNGSGCEPFSIPENAQLDFTGNNFSCVQNFKRVGEKCVPMTQAEIQYQNYLIMLAAQCGGSKSVDVEGTCGSDSVNGEIDVCQGSKEASGELEFDNGLTTQFEGTWTSADEFEGTDTFGNSCDLEVD